MDASRVDCTLPMPLNDDCGMVLDEIRRGHGLLLKLRDLTNQTPLNASASGSWIGCVRDLIDEVLRSLTGPLYMLTGTKPSEETQLVGFMSSHGSRTNPTCGRNDRKRLTGGKRTRRYTQYETKLTKKPNEEDGYVWNKYGQKKIFGAQYRRSYYKCSQKTDQGCPATKQVQRSNDEPSMFVVTYIGKHCCQPIIYLSADKSTAQGHPSDGSFSITFEKSVNPNYYPPVGESTHHPLPLTNTLLQHSRKNRQAVLQNDNEVCPTLKEEDLKYNSPKLSWGNGSNNNSLIAAAGENLFGDADDFEFKSFLSQNEDLELLLFNSS